MILSDFRTVMGFSTAMFWHIRQKKTYFAGKILNICQRNLIQNPSWSHNNSQKPWNIKSNILFLSLLYFWCCLFYFQLQWMWITTDAVFVLQGGGNNHIWYYMIIIQSSYFPDIFLLYFIFLVIETEHIMQLSKSPTSPQTDFKMLKANIICSPGSACSNPRPHWGSQGSRKISCRLHSC